MWKTLNLHMEHTHVTAHMLVFWTAQAVKILWPEKGSWTWSKGGLEKRDGKNTHKNTPKSGRLLTVTSWQHFLCCPIRMLKVFGQKKLNLIKMWVQKKKGKKKATSSRLLTVTGWQNFLCRAVKVRQRIACIAVLWTERHNLQSHGCSPIQGGIDKTTPTPPTLTQPHMHTLLSQFRCQSIEPFYSNSLHIIIDKQEKNMKLVRELFSK